MEPEINQNDRTKLVNDTSKYLYYSQEKRNQHFV